MNDLPHTSDHDQSDNDPPTYDELPSFQRRTDCNQTGSLPPYGEPPHVLEAIDHTNTLRNTPTAICCPGCGSQVATFETGLPAHVIHFKEDCPTCEVKLRRWSVVAVPYSEVATVSTTKLAQVTQQYWDRHLWAGITTLGHPRNEEFTKAYTDRATDYGWDWEVRCPLCRRSLSELSEHRLDYHHWNRGEGHDRGCCFCRDCHDALNDGQFDTDIDWQAREAGFSGKHDLQIARLAAREVLATVCGSLDELAHRLVQRYNVPYPPEYVRDIISQAFVDPELRELVEDEAVREGVVDHA